MRACLLVGLSAAALAVTPAAAADWPVAPSPVYRAPVAVYTWTGFYVGVNGGYGWSPGPAGLVIDSGPLLGTITPETTGNRYISGGLGGAQAGFVYQIGWAVFGFEADIQGAMQKNTVNTISTAGLAQLPNGDLICPVNNCVLSDTTRIGSFATARVRMGVAVDRLFGYVTAGGAWANVSDDLVMTNGIGRQGTLATLSTTRGGAAVGFGVESAFVDAWGAGFEGAAKTNWSVKLEYLYLAFSDVTVTVPIPAVFGGGALTDTVQFRDHILRLGINYRF